MDRSVVTGGVIVLVVAGIMGALLVQLGTVTYRSYLPPYETTSAVVATAGAALLVFGLLKKPSRVQWLKTQKASKYLSYLALANTVAAVLFILPVLVPVYDFPILITRWPGIYMVIAYTSLVVVGILGNVAWSAILRSISGDGSMESVYRWPLALQIALTEAGILGVAVFMFLGGYQGAYISYHGGGNTVVGASMEFAVIPSAVSIFGVVFGEMAGVANVIASVINRPSPLG